MVAWQIFWQSVLRLYYNIGPAFKVSLLPTVISGAALIGLWWPFIGLKPGDARLTAMLTNGGFPWWQMFVGVVILTFCGLWTAVSWHRYVLLDEEPGWVPPLRVDRFWAYFLRGLLVGLLLAAVGMVIVIVVSLPLTVISMAFGQSSTASAAISGPIALLVLWLALYLVGLRLAIALVGAALGAEGGIRDTWRATKGRWGTFTALAVLLTILQIVAGAISALASASAPSAIIWQIAYSWVAGMVGLSILTTLYGYFVEKRALG